MRLARLCNCTPWELGQRPAEEIVPYIQLLEAIDHANGDIAKENQRRTKNHEDVILRRISLAD